MINKAPGQKTLPAALILGLICAPAAAEEGFSFGLMAGSSTYEEPGFNFKLPTYTARLGYDLNNYLGAELRGATSASNQTSGVNMKINTIGSALVRLSWSPSDKIFIRLLAGMTDFDADANNGTTTTPIADTEVSYGVNLDLFSGKDNGLSLEIMEYASGTANGVKYTLTHMGIGYFQYF